MTDRRLLRATRGDAAATGRTCAAEAVLSPPLEPNHRARWRLRAGRRIERRARCERRLAHRARHRCLEVWGVRPPASARQPNDLLLWLAIRHACEQVTALSTSDGASLLGRASGRSRAVGAVEAPLAYSTIGPNEQSGDFRIRELMGRSAPAPRWVKGAFAEVLYRYAA